MTILIQNIPLAKIRTDGGTQPRVKLDHKTVDEYADAITEGAKMPPVICYFDGSDYWLADGYHRLRACEEIVAVDINAEVHNGTQRDAVLHSVGANAEHGLRRTNDDKHRAGMTMLDDPEWKLWPQSKIARQCGVSREYVSRVYSSATPSCARSQDAVRLVERGDRVYEQNTANIGKKTLRPQNEPVPETAPLAIEPDAHAPELVGPSDDRSATMKATARVSGEVLAKQPDSGDALAMAQAEITHLTAKVAALEQRVKGLQRAKADAIKRAERAEKKTADLQKKPDRRAA